MKKKIAKVRKRISNRRKLTFSDYPYQKKHDFHHVNLEEKHGFSPHTLYTSGKKPSSKMYRKTIVKGVTRLFLAFALDRKSTRLNSSHVAISYAVFCLKKNNTD